MSTASVLKRLSKKTSVGDGKEMEVISVTLMRLLDGITHSMDMNLSKLQETAKDREAWHAAVHGVTKSWTRPNYNKELFGVAI